MSTGRLVAGVDCSTQAIKVVVVDPDSGESFSLEVELYGRWPWQRAADETADSEGA
jgi:sugar (pentulose or hexulose) kinase